MRCRLSISPKPCISPLSLWAAAWAHCSRLPYSQRSGHATHIGRSFRPPRKECERPPPRGTEFRYEFAPREVQDFLDRVAGDLAAVYDALGQSRRETDRIRAALRRWQSEQARARNERSQG
ncbi:hypothetical protein GA0070621_5904 [Micromonospora narathiwatensis]|uniref:DivIVA domain-containing protein n=1 Tax=Micromonospora narathiwatensis TaxID=299146 RepID=A0A1A9AG32_9ACTN|nr:hypothetical protein GA0070621_5904 [Micromonospora narathiwatensis]